MGSLIRRPRSHRDPRSRNRCGGTPQRALGLPQRRAHGAAHSTAGNSPRKYLGERNGEGIIFRTADRNDGAVDEVRRAHRAEMASPQKATINTKYQRRVSTGNVVAAQTNRLDRQTTLFSPGCWSFSNFPDD